MIASFFPPTVQHKATIYDGMDLYDWSVRRGIRGIDLDLYEDDKIADVLRNIYHAQSFMWTDLPSGEASSVYTVGDQARGMLKTLMDKCGIGPKPIY